MPKPTETTQEEKGETLESLWPFKDDGEWLMSKERFMQAIHQAYDWGRADAKR